jgi:hypothetical protein
MPYTNVWTTAAPLDTQAANQGAVDFRATKLDVMQRIASFGAGLLANRPTPEATSGTADWTGVMYWATDTKQVFMWTGSAWTDISADIPIIGGAVQKYSNITPTTLVDGGAGGIGILIGLPANALSVQSVFQISGRVLMPAAGSATPTSSVTLVMGGNSIVSYPLNTLAPGVFANDQYLNFLCNGISTGSATQQGYGYATLGIIGTPVTGETYASPFNGTNTQSSGINVLLQLDTQKSSGTTFTFQNLSVVIFS